MRPPPQDQPSTRGLTLAQMDSLRDRFARGDRIAVWQSGIAGLRWIDELVKSGAAIAASTDGYPSVFYANLALMCLQCFPGLLPLALERQRLERHLSRH
jgi:hypothetical protein